MTAKQQEHVTAAKKAVDSLAGKGSDIRTLKTGVRVRFKPVSAQTIDEAVARVQNPPVPVVKLEDEDREVQNPHDPEYLRQVELANQQRALAAIDIILMLGVELVDGLPEDTSWLRRLQFLAKRGYIDLSDFDLEDPFELEFVYKRHMCVAAHDLPDLMRNTGIAEDDIKRAEATFRGNDTGNASQ